jgi:hypothetical protein
MCGVILSSASNRLRHERKSHPSVQISVAATTTAKLAHPSPPNASEQSSATVAEAEPEAVDMEDIAGESSVEEDAPGFLRDSSGAPFHLRQDHEAAVIDLTLTVEEQATFQGSALAEQASHRPAAAASSEVAASPLSCILIDEALGASAPPVSAVNAMAITHSTDKLVNQLE